MEWHLRFEPFFYAQIMLILALSVLSFGLEKASAWGNTNIEEELPAPISWSLSPLLS